MKSIEWYERQFQKDQNEIKKDKMQFIKKIRQVGLNDIANQQKSTITIKTTLWMKIKKILNFLKIVRK